MTINSLEPYTLLDANNYMQIMKEQIIGDDLKLFSNKINIDPIENTDNMVDAPSASNNIIDNFG